MIDFAPLVYEQLIRHNGPPHQVDMTLEKMAQLMVDVRKWRRGAAGREDAAATVADVMILLEQMRLIVGADLVDALRTAKVEQIERSLQNGNQTHGK